MLQSLLQSLAFFTRLPVPARAHGPWRAGMVAWLPGVGILIGLGVAGTVWGARFVFPPPLAALLGFTAWVLITGGLHLDGLADCGDGLGFAGSREKRLEIMRDPRVGTFGALALGLLSLAKIFALTQLASGANLRLFMAVTLAAIVGRAAASTAITSLPTAQSGGLGHAFKQCTRPWEGTLALTFALALCILCGPRAVAAALGASFVFIVVGQLAKRRLGGISGDVLGALVEITEAVVLLAFCARLP